MTTPKEILKKLFLFELIANAKKLSLIHTNNESVLEKDLLIEAISVLNDLSIKPNDVRGEAKVTISSA